jgi:uncharacterized membrane protein (DUF485 family)
MGGFGHHAPHTDQKEPEDQQTIDRNARYGMVLFVVYLLFYGGFVLLTAFDREAMGNIVGGGVNLAIAYGFGLIAAAIVLAMIYGWLCRGGMTE